MEHSVSACSEVYEHFRKMGQTDGKSFWYQRPDANGIFEPRETFAYTPWERDWIKNELMVCKCSFPYWFYRYFFIVVDGQLVRPDVLVAQQAYLKVLADLDEKQLPILLLVLKARQLGISTVTEAIILWIALFRRGSHCLIASAEEEKSKMMSQFVWRGLDGLPLWMQPNLTGTDKKRGPIFGDNQTDILIQHGSMTKGIGRGDTPIAAHLSEVAYFPDPLETIESSLIRAMHENPRTFLVLESTARTNDDWLHDTWVNNRRGESTGYNRFTCLFLPWYLGHDKYPTPDFLRNHPIPFGWGPSLNTIRQAEDARLYVKTTPLIRQFFPENWEMPREQMWFYEFERHDAESSDDPMKLKKWKAEMAADERSCFQSRKMGVFENEAIDKITERAERTPYIDYAIVGDGIAEKFNLTEFQDITKQQISVNWLTNMDTQMSWKLIPLRKTPDDENLQFYLRVWEPPQKGYDYVVGIDPSSGNGMDSTVFSVVRKGRKVGEPDKMVACLGSAYIGSMECPGFAALLGIWYGTWMEPFPEALIAPETQIAVGDPITFQLDQLGYGNIRRYQRYDQKKVAGQTSRRMGWVTTGWSRQMLMEAFEHGVKTGWIIVYSLELIEEMAHLEADIMGDDKVRYDHAANSHNDYYMATAIAYFCSHDKETIMERMKSNLTPAPDAPPTTPVAGTDSGTAYFSRRLTHEEKLWSQFTEGGYDGDETRGGSGAF